MVAAEETRLEVMVQRAVEERIRRTRILFPRSRKKQRRPSQKKTTTGFEYGAQEDETLFEVRKKAKFREEYEGSCARDAADASSRAEHQEPTFAMEPRAPLPGKALSLATPSPSSVSSNQANGSKALAVAQPAATKHEFSASVIRRQASRWPRPEWHAPWKLYRVVSGHMGWVRSICFDPANSWFATGSADRTIKVWDLASGGLKLTLTGHIEQVTGLAVSNRHPYMFSCGLDKQVKCWDLEYNKVIRHYHGHLSGVYALKVHPTLDVLMTGGRDCTCRYVLTNGMMDTRREREREGGGRGQVCFLFADALSFPFLILILNDLALGCGT